MDFAGNPVLADVRSGKPVSALLPATRDGLGIEDLARSGPDDLVATYSTGPKCTSGVNGCGPKAGTCGAEVLQLDPATGVLTELARFGKDTLVYAAQPNPTGTELALLLSPCVPSYFNQHVEVLRLADGATWSIGAGLPRCHALGAPVWVNAGRSLLMTYGAAPTGAPYAGADGTCSQPQPAGLVEVTADRSQAGVSGGYEPPAPHCPDDDLASQGTSIYVMAECSRIANTEPVLLERLDTHLRPARTWTAGQCGDGDALAINPAGEVLLSAYLYCAPAFPGHPSGQPTTVLDTLAHGKLTHVASGFGGDLYYSDLAW